MSNEVKIILIGDANVGKTSIVTRFVKGTFDNSVAPTIGAAFLSKVFNSEYTMNIWDTAGQEQYHFLVPMYYRNAQIVILVFDLTNEKTFENTTNWIRELKDGTGGECTIVLCGSKSDLLDERKVKTEEAQKLATEQNYQYVEVSSLSGEGINLLFESAMNSFIESQTIDPKDLPPESLPLEITEEDSRAKKESCC